MATSDGNHVNSRSPDLVITLCVHFLLRSFTVRRRAPQRTHRCNQSQRQLDSTRLCAVGDHRRSACRRQGWHRLSVPASHTPVLDDQQGAALALRSREMGGYEKCLRLRLWSARGEQVTHCHRRLHESWSSIRLATGPPVVHFYQQCRLRAGARAKWAYRSFARPHRGLPSWQIPIL